MSDSSNFSERYEEIVGASGWRTLSSPTQLVEQWRDFVSICEGAYRDTIYDFYNERAVRDLLERVMNAPSLAGFEQLTWIREHVEVSDARFKSACREDVQWGQPGDPWWHRCVPNKATGEFADDLRDRGIEPRRYEPSPNHDVVRSRVGRQPTNGQTSLDRSVEISPNTTRRVAADPLAQEFVVFDQTTANVFHGHVRSWSELSQSMQSALIRAGQVTRRGRIS